MKQSTFKIDSRINLFNRQLEYFVLKNGQEMEQITFRTHKGASEWVSSLKLIEIRHQEYIQRLINAGVK